MIASRRRLSAAARSGVRRVAIAAATIALAACDALSGVDFNADVEEPAFRGDGPSVLFDAAHHNHHKLDRSYRPFARLLANDGFRIGTLDQTVSAGALREADILVIVTALADTETNAEPAFTDGEIATVIDWIRRGGSLLLVTEHYPFANAVERLARALGLEVAKGMTFDAVNHRRETGDDSRLLFTEQNGLLAAHPITQGRNAAERVRVVETFTGDALKPRGPGAAPLLRLGATAVHRVGTPWISRQGGDVVVDVRLGEPVPVDGWLQGTAI
jgi:hypothetical protein